MRTGKDFREEHTLRTGERVVLRHIQPSDAEGLVRAYDALSPESRYRRFFGAASSLDGQTVRYLTEVDGEDHVAIVALVESLDLKTERGVGVARFVRSRDEKDVAEIAVVVTDDMQNKGLGTLLLSTAVVAAVERGIARFRGEVLSENRPMLALLEEIGAKHARSEGATVVFEIDLGKADDTTLSKMLRAAAGQLATFIRRLVPPVT